MNSIDNEIIEYYKGFEEREQKYIVTISRLQLENYRLRRENEDLRRNKNGNQDNENRSSK